MTARVARRARQTPLLLLLGASAVAAGWIGSSRHTGAEAQQVIIPPARLLVRTGAVPRAANESSGVAVSHSHPGVLWTHNDSGGEPRLYAIDLAGNLLGKVDVKGSGFVDWEEVDRGPCPASWQEDRDCLYIGDIGDNVGARRDVTLYVIVEPDPNDASVKVRGQFDFTYPTGADDAEALAVDEDGALVVVSKGRSRQVVLYEMDAAAVEAALASKERVTLNPGVRLPIVPRGRRLVTAAAFSPTGRLAVRTYSEVYLFDRDPAGGWKVVGSCNFWDRSLSGEAIDFLDADQMVITGEWERNRPGEIFRVRCDSAGT